MGGGRRGEVGPLGVLAPRDKTSKDLGIPVVTFNFLLLGSQCRCHYLPDREYHAHALSVEISITLLETVPRGLHRAVLITVELGADLFVKPSTTLPDSVLEDRPGSMQLLKSAWFPPSLGYLLQISKDHAL